MSDFQKRYELFVDEIVHRATDKDTTEGTRTDYRSSNWNSVISFKVGLLFSHVRESCESLGHRRLVFIAYTDTEGNIEGLSRLGNDGFKRLVAGRVT